MTSSSTAPVLIQNGKEALDRDDPAAALEWFQKALKLDPQNPEAWAQCGLALQRLQRYSEAVVANTNAQDLYGNPMAVVQPLPITPTGLESQSPTLRLEDYNFWMKRAEALINAGSYELAIASYDKALALQPEHPHIWNHRGMAYFQMGDHAQAIACFDQAIKYNPENYQPWHNRASVCAEQSQYEQAIADYDVALRLTQQQLWPAWEDRGMCLYFSQGYDAAIAAFEEGLQAMQPENAAYARACGILNQRKGDFQYRKGHTLMDPVPIWQEAKLSYLSALDFLTFPQFPELHLLTLQSLLTVCCHLGDQYALQTMLPEGLDRRDRLLRTLTLSSEQRQGLREELTGLDQLQVDLLTQDDPTQALLTADAHLQSHLDQVRPLDPAITPDWGQLQKLLPPWSALVFWHLSPAAISVFILKLNQFPKRLCILPANELTATLDGDQALLAARQRHQLNEWLETSREQRAEPLHGLDKRLQELQAYLNIDRLCAEALSDVQKVLLVTDPALRHLPLQSVFPERFIVTQIPSLRMGLALRRRRLPSQQFLLVDPQSGPETIGLQQFYPQATALLGPQATKARLTAALKLMSGQGWATITLHEPTQQPAIVLADGQVLTLEELLELDLSRFSLICLSMDAAQPINQSQKMDLATGLLLAGVAHVVSSQWWVAPVPRTLILLKLHHGLQHKVSPASALHQAQQWLQTLTYTALEQWGHRQELDADFIDEMLQTMNAGVYPYADPIHWAGFRIMGTLS